MNQTSSSPTRRNHNLAIAAITLALLGTFLGTSPFVWLLLPAVVSAGLAYRAIRRQPERYSGMLFVLATWALSLVIGILYLILYLSQ